MKKFTALCLFLFFSLKIFAIENSDAVTQRLFEAGYDFLNEFEFFISMENEERLFLAAANLEEELQFYRQTEQFKKYSRKDRNFGILINRMIANAQALKNSEKKLGLQEKIRFGTDINQNLLKLSEFNSQFYTEALRIRFYVLISSLIFILAVLFFLQQYRKKIKKTSFELQKNQEYTNLVLNAIENERSQISNELHDTIAQEIRAIKFEAENAESLSENDVSTSFAKIGELSSKCMNQLRAICYNLLPPDLKLKSSSVQLESLMEFLCRKFNEDSNGKIECSFRADKNLPEIKNQDTLLNIFRIVQEALNNIKNHSNAGFCSIALCREQNFNGVVIYVTDDGIGIKPEILEDGKKMHFGLHSMRSRAKLINAEFGIVTEENDGTEIILKVWAE